jgi:Holliday junction resolvase YEN1
MPYALFFPAWIEALQEELRTDAHGHLGQRYCKLAKRLAVEFPPYDIVRLYVKPRTKEREEVVQMRLYPTLPNIRMLAHTCKRLFTFGKECGDLQEKFRDIIWPGICIQLIVHQARQHDVSYADSLDSGGCS